MALFLKRLSLFLTVFLLIIIIGIILPPTPKVRGSLLFAKIDKDSLLVHTPSPRLLLIGGSNLSFGINSNSLKDSLKLNPVNTAIHAGIGLKYMLDHSLEFIKRNDIVIIVPEYEQYYGTLFYGREELFRLIFDVSRSDYKLLSLKQWAQLSPYIINYACSKYNFKDYLPSRTSFENSIYDRSAFNSFGDASAHWTLKGQHVSAFPEEKNKFNNDVTNALLTFKRSAENKGATVFLSFPGLQSSSFDNNATEIRKVQTELIRNGFKILGTPLQFKMADSLCFNTPYHLTKRGLDQRTNLLIHDMKKYVTKTSN